jgi:hypothetical protein
MQMIKKRKNQVSPQPRQFNNMLALCILLSVVCQCKNTGLVPVSAFTRSNSIPSYKIREQTKNENSLNKQSPLQPKFSPKSIPNPLQMSSVGREPEDNKASDKIKSWIESKLPAPPEDQLCMSGDIAAIFLYSYIDHTVNGMFNTMLNAPPEVKSGVGSASLAIQTASSEFADVAGVDLGSSAGNLPVWFDTMNSAPFGTIPLTSALPLEHHITYAPAISTAGMSAVLLSSTWLICGYFTGVFQFRNTLECSTRRAISMTAWNWLFTCIVMAAIAYGSDYMVGCVDCLHKSVGLTKADADYIFDSLSVLLSWRFILSSFLGYGDDGKGDQ